MSAEISLADLETEVEAAWEARDDLSAETRGPIRTAVTETLALLDAGKARVAEKIAGELSALDASETRLKVLEADLIAAEAEFRKNCAALSEARKKAAAVAASGRLAKLGELPSLGRNSVTVKLPSVFGSAMHI